jgi:hypothetical protein
LNPKQKSLIVGAMLGAAIGALAGHLFSRGLDQPRDESDETALSLRSIPPSDMVKIAIAVVGVLRTVAELGERI